MRSDFADMFEVKGNRIVRRGRISTDWSESRQQSAHDLSQQGFLPRACIIDGASRPAPRRSMPTAG